MSAIRGPLVVTGTDTGVGKTIATAAIAATAGLAGLRVSVIKPGQTGIPPGFDEESDIEVVVRLADPARARNLASYPDPLAPATAARVAGLPALEFDSVVATVRSDLAEYDLVVVEGAGGLLVPMGVDGWTIADLAVALRAATVVVARAGLGTLNHTALTLEACARRGIETLVVIGAWPAEPELVHHSNLHDLPGTLAGALPDAASGLSREIFLASAPAWLGPALYGSFDARRFPRTFGVSGVTGAP